MTEIVHAPEASVADTQTEQPDVIDLLAGIAPGDWLDQLQHVRVTGILPRTAVLEFEQWLAQRSFDGVTIVPCRVG